MKKMLFPTNISTRYVLFLTLVFISKIKGYHSLCQKCLDQSPCEECPSSSISSLYNLDISQSCYELHDLNSLYWLCSYNQTYIIFLKEYCFHNLLKYVLICFCFLASQRTATACNYVTSLPTNMFL